MVGACSSTMSMYIRVGWEIANHLDADNNNNNNNNNNSNNNNDNDKIFI